MARPKPPATSKTRGNVLEPLATLWAKLLSEQLKTSTVQPLFGQVLLTLLPQGPSLGVQVEDGRARVCPAQQLKGPTLLALRGSSEGLKSFFDGTFESALSRKEVHFEAAPHFLSLMGVAP